MPEQVLTTSTRTRLPSLAKLLAVVIIVLSVSGVGIAVFALTEQSVPTRQSLSHTHRPGLTSTHRTQPRQRH